MKSTIKIITAILLLISSVQLTKAQDGGLQFEQGLSWQQVLDKAKAEHKYIFVDCYATWCGPCKEMDKNVYPLKEVGDAYNRNFICIRLQMDKTARDNDETKSWYQIADKFTKDYTIVAYPTFLFFSPDGKAVNKVTGSLQPENFIKIAADAEDLSKQYYTLLQAYQNGKRDYANIPALVKMADALGDKTLTTQIAKNYMHDHLDHLSEEQFLTHDNLFFISSYPDIVVPSDRIFRLCYHQSAKVDTAIHDKTYADFIIYRVINQQEVWPKTDQAKKTDIEPDWNQISNNITKKYGKQYVTDNLTNAKYNWYRFKNDEPNAVKYLTKIVDGAYRQNGGTKSDPDFFNSNAFEIFQHDNDKADLEEALKWMTDFMKNDPNNPYAMDTQANLLYKLGKKDEAVELETKATRLDLNEKDFTTTLQKMQKDEPTWIN